MEFNKIKDMNNLETRKEVASLAYALEHFDEDANILALQQAWIAGFETAEKGIWISVEEDLPKDDKLKLVYIEHINNPIFNTFKVCHYEGDNWYCLGGRNSQEVVTKWVEIPQ